MRQSKGEIHDHEVTEICVHFTHFTFVVNLIPR